MVNNDKVCLLFDFWDCCNTLEENWQKISGLAPNLNLLSSGSCIACFVKNGSEFSSIILLTKWIKQTNRHRWKHNVFGVGNKCQNHPRSFTFSSAQVLSEKLCSMQMTPQINSLSHSVFPLTCHFLVTLAAVIACYTCCSNCCNHVVENLITHSKLELCTIKYARVPDLWLARCVALWCFSHLCPPNKHKVWNRSSSHQLKTVCIWLFKRPIKIQRRGTAALWEIWSCWQPTAQLCGKKFEHMNIN